MPSGPGILDNSEIVNIAQTVPPPIATFLLTSETTGPSIIKHYQKVHTSVIQLVDSVPAGAYHSIKNQLPAVKLVQVIHIRGESSMDQALEVSECVDALLLDSGNPDADTKILGGTGKTHNWDISRQIVKQTTVPVFLAGGLNPQNVRKAIETVQPYGLDLCSGIRTQGKLDEKKLASFMEAVGYSNG
jgi:phosphoribosylanthranilate isomerase